jgi:glycosyltransferase involved in cell wall biosynthesis
MKHLSIVSGCFNEEDNVQEFYDRITHTMRSQLPQYEYEIILIDNASTDGTVARIRQIAACDQRVKLIVNNRNFGIVRSGYHAFLQATGDAVIVLVSDLQDPPEMLPELVRKWEEGYDIALAQKTQSEEFPLFFLARRAYYALVNRLSEVNLIENVTGFGIYDRKVVDEIRRIGDPYPYFRGLICELGFRIALVPFTQPRRKRGFSKNSLYTLYDLAMLGITNHSKIPLRVATFSGFCLSLFSFLIACVYLVYKLLFWDSFQLGTAPVVIGLFFFGAVQLFFIGILGEYIGAIYTQVLRRPPVIERERVNFGPARRSAEVVEQDQEAEDRGVAQQTL